MRPNRMLVWEGVSALDGKTPVIVLATGLATKSANTKTGDMVQVHILLADVEPHLALKQGLDPAICGACPHKSVTAGGSGACYVQVSKAQLSCYRAHKRSGSAPFDVEAFRGRKVRFGAYGDPAAVPFEVWEAIASVADGVTGYTHQWRSADHRFSRYLMASADSAEEGRMARAMGYRSFIVRAHGEPKPKGAVVCPASNEAGKRTTCAACMQCGGTGNGRKADITIEAHGAMAGRFRPLALSVVA